MRILFVGDIYGRPGREAAGHFVPLIRETAKNEFFVGNGENGGSHERIAAVLRSVRPPLANAKPRISIRHVLSPLSPLANAALENETAADSAAVRPSRRCR